MHNCHRQTIEHFAKEAFATHELTVQSRTSDNKPYLWRCQRPGTWNYGYFVAELLGAVIVYGDIGELIIAQGPSYNLEWLEKAINSMGYVLEKSTFRRDHFVEESFASVVRERGKDPEKFGSYAEYYLETGDSDVYEACHDWSPTALWTYMALHKFVELKRKMEARER